MERDMGGGVSPRHNTECRRFEAGARLVTKGSLGLGGPNPATDGTGDGTRG